MKERDKKLMSEYIRELELSGKSVKNVKLSLRLFFEYLEKKGLEPEYLKIRDAQDFQVYLSTRTDARGSIHYTRGSVVAVMGSLTSFYDNLKRKGIIYSNPFLEVKRVKAGKALPKNILNEEDMNKFLSHLKKFMKGKDLIERRGLYKAHVIAELMYSTGARINEIMKLKPSDIDFYRGLARITDTKTGQIREGILNSFAEKALKIYVDDMMEYVVFGKNGGDQSLLFGSGNYLKTWLNSTLAAESERAGFGKFTSHHFRHAVGYHLLRGGCDIRYIQEILGHRALNTTQIYTRVDKEDLKSVIDEYHPRNIRRKKSGNENL